MPQIQLYTNLNKSKLDNAFAQSFIAAVAASIGAPKEAVLLHIIPDQVMYLRTTDEPCAFLKLGAGAGKINAEANKKISEVVCTEMEKVGIPATRCYIDFLPLIPENIGFNKTTYAEKFGFQK
jgi:hypothetical protein